MIYIWVSGILLFMVLWAWALRFLAGRSLRRRVEARLRELGELPYAERLEAIMDNPKAPWNQPHGKTYPNISKRRRVR